MKVPLISLLLVCQPLTAVELDTTAVGRDLNGWNAENVAWYGTDGLSFRALLPSVQLVDGGAIKVRMTVEQVARRTAVYHAEIQLIVSPDGLVQTASVAGRVDGAAFTTGSVTRPQPATASTDGEAGVGVVDVTPVNAEAAMREEINALLNAAIEQARAGDDAPRRDVAARIFSVKAGESSSLAKATGLAVRSLFRRVGP